MCTTTECWCTRCYTTSLNIYSCHPAYSYLRKNEYWNLMRLDYDSWKEKASTFEIKVRGVDVHARKTLRKEKLSV